MCITTIANLMQFVSKMTIRLFVALLLLPLIVGTQYSIVGPNGGNNDDLQQFIVKDSCNSPYNAIPNRNGACTGRRSYVAVCLGPTSTGAYNGLPNSGSVFIVESRMRKNRTCVDTGNGFGIYMLPDELVSFVTINDYKNFSLLISMTSQAPFDNYMGLYFVNYATNLLEPVNVTYSTIGNKTNAANAAGISVFQLYFRADDNATTGEPQTTLFNAYFQVNALHKLTVYCALSFLGG